MAANVPDPMEREREHPRLTSAPKIDHRFLTNVFKVKTCMFDDCEDPAKCLFKHRGEQGRRDLREFHYSPKLCLGYNITGRCRLGDTCPFAHGHLESWFHPRAFTGIHALKLELEAWDRYSYAGIGACDRAAAQHILDLKSTGHICEYKYDDFLLDPSYNGTGNVMAIVRAGDAMSKHGQANNNLRIISGSCKLTPSPSTLDVVWYSCCQALKSTGSTDGPKFLTTSGSCKLVLPGFAGTSTVGSRMPLGWADPWRIAGGGSAQTDPDHGMLVEPDDLKLDSGASNHVVGEKILLQGYKSLVFPWYIHVADGYPLEVVGNGAIITKEFFIPNVYRVKGLKENLISVSQLARDHGLFCGFYGSQCDILKPDGERVGGGILQDNGIYKLRFLEVPEAEAEAGYENA